MQSVQQLDPDQRWGELSLVLTDDPGITSLNEQYFGKPQPTDVISFRYDSFPGEDNACSGEVIVNVQRAVEEGRRRESPSHELALYIAHGCQHLTGATDDTPEKRAQMRVVEEAWLEEAASLGLLDILPGNEEDI